MKDAFFYMKKDETICVMVEMDEKEFGWLVHSYKDLWNKKTIGDNISALNLIRDILHAAEEGCKNEL